MAIQENCCSLEFTDEACSDGIDNDANGFVDCEDFACSQGLFVTVCDGSDDENCGDGIDNDGDGYVDCADQSCFDVASCVETECSNGVDDDGDGKTDCADGDCAALPQCEGPEDTLEACQDGVDNDNNMATQIVAISPAANRVTLPSHRTVLTWARTRLKV